MENKIKELAQARASLAYAKDKARILEAELLSNPVYVQLKGTIQTIADTISQMEESLRAAALESFALDGNKKPHPAVTIKMFSSVKIANEESATEWCFANFRPALKLDAKIFEKAAKDGNVPSGLVVVGEEPKAQIATDLSEYV